MTIIPQNTATKQCGRCKQPKPATKDFFTRDRSKPDGFYTLCKVCRSAPKPVPPLVPDGYKRCRDCGIDKPATTEFFHATASYASKDCLNKQCKVCVSAYKHGRAEGVEKVAIPKDTYKECGDCHKKLPPTFDYYSFNRYTPDRLCWQCKDCSNKRNRAWRLNPSTQQKRRDYREARREIEQIYHQVYRQTHKKEDRQYRQVNKLRLLGNHRRYSQTEKGKVNRQARALRRIARKKNVQGNYTVQQIRDLLKRQKHKCYYCQKKLEQKQGRYLYHIDHTFPLSRVAGSDIPANDINYLVLACPTCNMSKGDKYPWEWEQGGRLL